MILIRQNHSERKYYNIQEPYIVNTQYTKTIVQRQTVVKIHLMKLILAVFERYVEHIGDISDKLG